MPQIISKKSATGLNTYQNPFTVDISASSLVRAKGATVICDNTMLSRQNMVGNRWGFAYYTQNTSALVTSFLEFQNYIIQHQAGDMSLWLGTNSSGTRTQFTGSYCAPANYRMDGTVSRGSLFVTTTNGPYKLDQPTGNFVKAGAPPALDTRISTTGTGGGWLSGYSTCAYRVTWSRTDANGQLLEGTVSQQAFVTTNNRVTCTITSAAGTATVTTSPAHTFNTGDSITIAGATQIQYNGTFTITYVNSTSFTYTVVGSPASPATGTITADKYLNTVVAFTVPADALLTDQWKIYRTLSVASNLSAGDTEFLIAQVTNTNAPLTTISYTDSTADALLITPLYTNSDQAGIQQNDNRPPFACSIAVYKDFTFYANTGLDFQITIQQLGLSGIVAGTSYIKITQTATGTYRLYTYATSEVPASNQFQLYTSGTPATNISGTMQSLCHVINSDAAGLWYAEYTSGAVQAPGIIRIWGRDYRTGAFYITVDATATGNDWTPILPTSGPSVSATSDMRANRIYYSKYQQPDHVPLANSIDVGRLDKRIERIVALRDGLFVLKEDGVYYLYGLTVPFTVLELDLTTHILAPSSAVALNNQIYMLSNQGIVSVSSAGSQVISTNIEPDIQFLLPYPNLRNVCFGVGHESERTYSCWLPLYAGDTYAKQAYQFHVFLEDWVHWTKPAAGGIALDSDRKMYISSGMENAVLQQRKTGADADCSDEEIPVTITAVSGTNITVTWINTLFTPTAGYVLQQGVISSNVTAITYVSGSTWVLAINLTLPYTTGAATVFVPIYSHIRFPPDTVGEVGQVKQFINFSFVLSSQSVSQVTMECATNEAPYMYSFLLNRTLTLGWGKNPWGTVGWGDLVSPVNSTPYLLDVPIPDTTGEALSVGWIHGVAQEQYFLAQSVIIYEALAETEAAA